ncbi:hypothetical protein [Burkholderia gladioli]|uniref:hypothetical protein n=1 Tax=Burkholderia gladioli TaxID=28095 RepID=UPI000FDB7ACF|nr:hypothetical protein [Burkholderia gladioli]
MPNDNLLSVRQQLRLVELLDAADQAGLSPIRLRPLHALIYLSNVLSPVWDLTPIDGKLLKRFGGPFYPLLQAQIDRLVGSGIVLATDISHIEDGLEGCRLDASYQLEPRRAASILKCAHDQVFDIDFYKFSRELALAFAALPFEIMERISSEDATYGDRNIDAGNVIDFSEWQQRNFTANVATNYGRGRNLTSGERLHLYVEQLYGRLH